MKTAELFGRINWAMLAEQKLALLETISITPSDHVELLTGLLNLIDAIQDAAEKDGFSVVFLTSDDDR